MARPAPSMKPSSSSDRRMPVEKKASGPSVSGRLPPVSKHSVPNGQRLPPEKSRASGVARPQDRNTSVQHNRDNRTLKKENVSASQTQMKPPKQSSLRANLDRDHTRMQKPPQRANLDRDHTRVQKPPLRANIDRDHARVQKPHGQLRMNSQSGSIKKDPNNRKRRAEESDDDEVDPLKLIRGMFRYNKDKYADISDDDSDMCMEVGFDTIQKEESRSARIARQEDEEELEKIMEEERQERLRKKAKMRKMSHR
ncbi:hypothetical protein RND81_11G206300 [Saponaria officinalis]